MYQYHCLNPIANVGLDLFDENYKRVEDMKDAQVHPEDHGNLIVRVGGFSKKFVDCERETQDELIMRYGE